MHYLDHIPIPQWVYDYTPGAIGVTVLAQAIPDPKSLLDHPNTTAVGLCGILASLVIRLYNIRRTTDVGRFQVECDAKVAVAEARADADRERADQFAQENESGKRLIHDLRDELNVLRLIIQREDRAKKEADDEA